MNILVADDNALTSDILCDMLRKTGHACEWAANGEGVLTRLNYKDYDVVVLDYYMPTLDGLNVVREMRKDSKTQHIPVVMITAAAPNELVEVLQKQLDLLGKACLLQKPFDYDVLLLAIDKIIKGDQK